MTAMSKNRLFGIGALRWCKIIIKTIIVSVFLVWFLPNGSLFIYIIKTICIALVPASIFMFAAVLANGWITDVPKEELEYKIFQIQFYRHHNRDDL